MNDEMASPPQVPPHDAGATGVTPPVVAPTPPAASLDTTSDGAGRPATPGDGVPVASPFGGSSSPPRPVSIAARAGGPPRPGSSRPAPASAAAQVAPVIPTAPALPADLAPPRPTSPSQPSPPDSDDDEQYESIAAMPIIPIDTEIDPDDRITQVTPINVSAPAPGIQTSVDPGWTPPPAQAVPGILASAAVANAANVPPPSSPQVSLLSTDVEELAEDDISPASEPPPPPRSLPNGPASLPPRPPPPIAASAAPPPVVAAVPPAPSSAPDVDVDLSADDEAPISPVPAAVPPPPPAAAAAAPPPPPAAAVTPPPPPSAAPAAPAGDYRTAAPAPSAPPAAAAPAAAARPISKPAADGKKRVRPWWEEVFDDDFLRSIKQPTARQIAREVAFIDDRLGLREGAYILDLACGNGRHAIDLTRRGYKVVGFDLSLAMMARAQDEAEAAQQKINFLHGDMREMTFENMFDGIYNWGLSFGYFEEEKNFAVLQKMHRALRSGGVLLLDLCNRDYIASNQPNLVWFEGDGCICMDETNLDFITSRLKVKRTVMLEDGRTREIDFSIRLYSLNELGKLLHEAGFKVLEVSGDVATPGVFFGTQSPRCIILAERA